MRGLCKVGLALGLAAFVVSPALAQRGPGGGAGLGFLLQNKSVQEELKIDKDQGDKVREAFTKFREDHKDDFEKLRDRNLSREDRAEVMKKVSEGSEKVAADVLKPDQIKRLKQIRLQQEGVNAFASPDTQKALKLTDKQKDEIKGIMEDLQKSSQEIFQNAGDDRQAAFRKVMELRKDKLEAAMKALTDEQKTTYKEMTGKPFEIKFERPGT
jgi:hypothetical protein